MQGNYNNAHNHSSQIFYGQIFNFLITTEEAFMILVQCCSKCHLRELTMDSMELETEYTCTVLYTHNIDVCFNNLLYVNVFYIQCTCIIITIINNTLIIKLLICHNQLLLFENILNKKLIINFFTKMNLFHIKNRVKIA